MTQETALYLARIIREIKELAADKTLRDQFPSPPGYTPSALVHAASMVAKYEMYKQSGLGFTESSNRAFDETIADVILLRDPGEVTGIHSGIFRVGDKVTFINDYRIAFPGRTITATEIDNVEMKYFISPTDTPWYSVRGENLRIEYQ